METKANERRMLIAEAMTVVAVLLFALPVPAQTQQEISRNKGITSERPAAAPSERRLIAPQPVPQPPPCDGANFNTNDFNDNISMGGPIVGIALTPVATETISRIEVFTGGTTGPIGLAIWSDDSSIVNGKPLADLGDTGYFSITTSVGWQGKNLTTPVTVIGGTKYWIVFDPTGGEQAPVQNGTGQQYWGSYHRHDLLGAAAGLVRAVFFERSRVEVSSLLSPHAQGRVCREVPVRQLPAESTDSYTRRRGRAR